MATVAENAVLISSAGSAKAVATLPHVRGPSSDFHRAQHVLASYPTMGFQATHYGRACAIARRMLQRQPPSKVFQVKDGKYVLVPREVGEDGVPLQQDRVYPNLFFGATANLLGTGCREAIRFLVQEGVSRRVHSSEEAIDIREDQLMFRRLKEEFKETYGRAPHPDDEVPAFHSFLSAIVTSGGGVEHDLRRACAPYVLGHYASETMKPTSGKPAAVSSDADVSDACFGNVAYPSQGTSASHLFDSLMRVFVMRLLDRQARRRAAAATKRIPEKYEDVCTWTVTPSEVWALCGLWLVDMLTEALYRVHHADAADAVEADGTSPRRPHDREAAYRTEALTRARTTVVYWAALQQVPLFSPSFVDGDITHYLLPPTVLPTAAGVGSCAGDTSCLAGRARPASAAPSSETDRSPEAERLQVDLVRDVHAINKLAMLSRKTAMLICGGGVVKHHICNANLMRNGADYTILANSGQEFDGSDAGAKPEEAVSWGKVRMEGQFVKVYGEVSLFLPLLVADVFVPAVRQRDGTGEEEAEEGATKGRRMRRSRRRRRQGKSTAAKP